MENDENAAAARMTMKRVGSLRTAALVGQLLRHEVKYPKNCTHVIKGERVFFNNRPIVMSEQEKRKRNWKH